MEKINLNGKLAAGAVMAIGSIAKVTAAAIKLLG